MSDSWEPGRPVPFRVLHVYKAHIVRGQWLFHTALMSDPSSRSSSPISGIILSRRNTLEQHLQPSTPPCFVRLFAVHRSHVRCQKDNVGFSVVMDSEPRGGPLRRAMVCLSGSAVLQLLTSKANRQFIKPPIVNVSILTSAQTQQVVPANYLTAYGRPSTVRSEP